MTKLKIWNEHKSWSAAEAAWDEGAQAAAQQQPIKGLKNLPKVPGITADTAKNLKWKSFLYMLMHDHKGEVRRGILRHPIKHAVSFVKSLLKGKSYYAEGDFYYYGVKGLDEFKELLIDPDALFVVGFSYCEKPFECPSGRFTDECIRDPDHLVCRQCKVGKCMNALPDQNSFPVLIPTIHYIGGKIFDIQHAHPGKKLIFMITACELVLEMFGDWGNMAGIRGIGVRFGGRVCNTMKAFELSEEGIKPGLTVVVDETHQKMLELIRHRRQALSSS
ncbi:MAG: hypothetical protein Q8K75_01025 [Chlamydiales bacterium]|nr:hypothetical protein [Chlamydiales bacterium]